jgi:acetylornithine deacetylase
MKLRDELATLVGFPSVSSRPMNALADHVAQRCVDLGMQVERVEHAPGKVNLIATAGPAGTDGIVLSGHMDVVPTENQPWSSDPFVLTERDGKLYGRGAADMKGFFASTFAALDQINLRALGRELMLVWTADEEIGCMGSAAVVDALRGRPVPSACLIGEPTGFCCFRMHPGHAHVWIEVRGQAAHSSRPELGANAILTAARVIGALDAFAKQLRAEVVDLPMPAPWVVLNVAKVSGGSAVNIVPDRCTIELGYRPLPGTDDVAVFRRLQAMLEATFGEGRCVVHAHLGAIVPSMLTPGDTPLAALLQPHTAAGAACAPFATDGGNLARAGMSTVIFGPGSIDVAHQADEHIDEADLHRAVGILGAVIHQRCVV